MKRLLLVLALTSFAPLPALADPAPAADAQAQAPLVMPLGTPLVTLRFNQRNLYFEKALANAVAKARETKPDVNFIVMLHPSLQGGSDVNASRVMSSIRSLGVPEAQITGMRGDSSGQNFDEVMVYVQ